MAEIIAQARLVRVENMCDQWGLDLTAGCEHACMYCHFHKHQVLSLRHEHGGEIVAKSLAVDSFLSLDQYPDTLYLSPHTDPLAPSARGPLEAVLKRILPLGVRVIISTKNVVTRRIFRILADYPEQVLVLIGLTSLDDDRNKAVEPGCAPALARLANFDLAKEYGIPSRFTRLDPILPGVDDAHPALGRLLDELVLRGTLQVSATYLFLTPFTVSTPTTNPYMREAATWCREASPTAGGLAYSVPLPRKVDLYSWLKRECTTRGLHFGACGCKDLRLGGNGFATACTNPCLSECTGRTICSLPVIEPSLPVDTVRETIPQLSAKKPDSSRLVS